MEITSGSDYGPIKAGSKYSLKEGYVVLVGKNNSGKSSLLQLMFKQLVDQVGVEKVCILFPERVFVESTVEIGGGSLRDYNRGIHRELSAKPLSYDSPKHPSQSAFKLIINNFRQRKQLDSSDQLLKRLGFSPIDLQQNKPIIDDISVSLHGSGLRSILTIIAALTDPTIKYLLIDEPEQSLEPEIQKYARDMFYEASGKEGKKIIVTTHSHLFLNRKDNSSNYIIKRKSTNVGLDQVKSEIEMYDIVYKLLGSSPNDLFFPKNYLIVEGSSDQVILEKMLELRKIEKSKIKVIAARGISEVGHYSHSLSNALTPYVMKESIYKKTIVALIDLPTSDDSKKEAKEIGKELKSRLVTLPVESLEKYLPEKLFKRVGRVKNTDLAKLKGLKGNYELESKLKTEISNQIASGMKVSDLEDLTRINSAIEKAGV